MAIETAEDIANNVLLHYEEAGIARARLWVQNAFRELVKRRLWSWKLRRGQFVFPAAYSTGTVSATQGFDIITGSGTVWTQDMVGRQFRISNLTAPYTILAVSGAGTSLQIDKPWGAANQSGISYEIYQAYVTVPDDFEAFDSITNPQQGYQLYYGLEQRELDQVDPQRSSSGSPYAVASADYTTIGNADVFGTIDGYALVHAHGAGAVPVAGGLYTGTDDAVFTIEVTTGGAPGTAAFKWFKNTGSPTTGVLSDAAMAMNLQDGVTVYWQAGTYVLGDVFTISVKAVVVTTSPRFEVWPHVKAPLVLPFFYEASVGDIFEPGATIPRGVTGEVLLEGALAKLAAWPGKDEKNPNPYFLAGRNGIVLSELHQRNFERLCERLEQKDDNLYPRDVTYYRQLPFLAGAGWLGADWYQKHA